MLVLTRKTNQSVMIGDIEVTVIEIRGEQIRLGISAPSNVSVHRKEIYLQVQEQNKAAAQPNPASTVGKTLDEMRQREKLPNAQRKRGKMLCIFPLGFISPLFFPEDNAAWVWPDLCQEFANLQYHITALLLFPMDFLFSAECS